MKKSLILLFLALYARNVYADNTCGANCRWNFDERTGTLNIEGTGRMGSFSVQQSGEIYINQAPWATYAKQIKNVYVGEGITTVGDYAFYNTTLENISLPHSLTTIGNQAFQYSNLSNIVLPEGLQYISHAALADTNIQELIIPSSVKTIDKYALVRSPIEKLIISDKTEFSDYTFVIPGSINKTLKEIYCTGNTQKCEENIREALNIAEINIPIKFLRTPKRIYTVEEATKLSKPIGNTFKIRYR